MLRQGTYPDTSLAEEELASRLRVSRTPVREALFQLCREGVLEDTGRGYRRPEMTARDVREIVELRRSLEPTMARAIVTQADATLIECFVRIVADEERALTLPDASAFVQSNARFRELFIERCGNRRIAQVMQTVDDQVAHLRQLTLGPIENRRATLAAHVRFIAALETSEPDAAAAAMLALIEAARRYYDTIWPTG